MHKVKEGRKWVKEGVFTLFRVLIYRASDIGGGEYIFISHVYAPRDTRSNQGLAVNLNLMPVEATV